MSMVGFLSFLGQIWLNPLLDGCKTTTSKNRENPKKKKKKTLVIIGNNNNTHCQK
jgi:hypothetical protein